MPGLEKRLASTVNEEKGTYEDILQAYRDLIYAQNDLDRERNAQKIYWLSKDVDATDKALNEMLKLEEQYQPLVKKVVSFATHVDLTYDILRAIAFELNNGYSFEETLSDLNISKENTPHFDIIVEFEDGSHRISTDCKVDLYSAESDYFWFQCEKKSSDKALRLDFRPCDVVFDIDHAEITLAPDKVERYVDEDDFNMDDADDKARYEYLCKVPIKKITFVRKVMNPMFKYMV
jgi:hypothetical protein